MADEVYEEVLDLNAVPDAEPESGNPYEVEVVDDTPLEDRGRSPLPEKIVKQLEEDDDEVEEYSSKVKQRIDQMKKAWHDERRAKEAALREREEAVRVAQTAYQERQAYLERLQQGEAWAIEQAKQRASLQLEQAKSLYRSAYESGDTDKILEAQQALNYSMQDYDRYASYQPQYAQTSLQQQQVPVYSPSAVQPAQDDSVPQPDSRTMEWGKSNQWFGQDDEMTSFALGVHQKLVKEGVSPQTDEYYERIDSRMREVFPDKFGKTKRQSSTVVAPVGRSPKGKKVVLTQTQVALAKRLGITPEAYARELVKQMEN